MQPHSLVRVSVALLGVFCVGFTAASPSREDYGEARRRRQTHPEATVALIPESSVSTGEEPATYLVPPAAPAGRAGPAGVWDLGYEASDILVPPLPNSHPGPYETMRQSDVRTASEALPAASDQQEYVLPQQPPTDVYSFVKTDKKGHFKWGVRYNGA